MIRLFIRHQETRVEPFELAEKPARATIGEISEQLLLEKKRAAIIRRMLRSRRNEAVQGVLKVAHADHMIIKVFWIVALVIASGLCAYLIVESVVTYLEYRVFTTSRTVIETPTEFPKVTICNYNQFSTKYAYELISSINDEYYPGQNVFDAAQTQNMSSVDKYNLILSVYTHVTSRVLSKNFSDTERQKLGQSLDDILYSCLFNNQACSADDFVWRYDRYYGNCWVFNSGYNASGHYVGLKKSSIAGQGFGLQLAFYINFYEKLSITNAIYGVGGYLRVENASYLGDDTLDGIYLTPGESPDVLVYRTFKEYLPKPYSSCEVDNVNPHNFDSHLYQIISHSAYQYKQQLCFIQCLQEMSNKTCNCTNPWFNSLLDADYCWTEDQIACTNNIFDEDFITEYVPANCGQFCPLECNTTEYKTSYSSAELVGDLYLEYIRERPSLAEDFINRTLDVETARKSFSFFFVAYETLTYTYSYESPSMNIVALLANIGGTLGLFLGVSALTVCEIFEILMELILINRETDINKL